MSAGQFSRAWSINDRTGNHWPSAHRLWAGGGAGPTTLTVRALHGLGDAVQMLQYAPRLRALAAEVRFDVPEVLRPLLPYFRGVEQVAPETCACPSAGCQPAEIEMMELPYLFRTTVAELPLATKYLELPSSLGERFSRLGHPTKPRIGLVWAGGEWDCERWIPLGLLQALFRESEFEWWSLQGGREAEQARGLPLRSLSGSCGDGLVALTAAIAHLDLVITVDTLAAHLAGALGKPAWLMLKHDADWRWMERRGDSPWYPSLRLFRQSSRGDWSSVVGAVRQALTTFEARADRLQKVVAEPCDYAKRA